MEKYIFILFIMLLIVLIVVIYFGYSKLNHIAINVNRNIKNISAIQSLLGNHPFIVNNTPVGETFVEESDDELDDEFRNQEFNNLENTVLNKENIYESEDENDESNILDDNSYNGGETEEIEEIGENEEIEEINRENEVEDERENVEENEKENEEENGEEKEENNEKKYNSIMERIDNTKTIEIESAKKKKSTPNKSPKNYEIGYQQVSENDGKKYEVVANKNGVKRWKIMKDS